MNLSIIVATRCRPGLLARTVETTLSNIRHRGTKLVIAADDDDVGTVGLKDRLGDPRIAWSVKPREDSLGAKYNRVMSVAPAEVYTAMVDHSPHVTPGFDEKILEAAQVYPDGYCFILNHLANLSFSQINATTHKTVEKMGYFFPEYFPYWFVDHWFEEMAKHLGRQVFVDVLLDGSRRPGSNQVNGTMEMKEPYFWGCVFDALHAERRELAHRIIDSPDFDETPARKRALKRNAVLWHEWSALINENLKEIQGQEVRPDDERYHRLQAKAIELVQKYGAKVERAAA